MSSFCPAYFSKILLKRPEIDTGFFCDRFSVKRFDLFKGLFRNFGQDMVPVLRPHLERLTSSRDESHQRCASEILCGLIRGTKHWGFEATKAALDDTVVPLMKAAFGVINDDCFHDWGTAFATAANKRDPNQFHWLLEALTDEPIRSQGSFTDTARLYLLQVSLIT